MTKNRLEAFSDGVIAIIITIMVLELRPPEGASFQALLVGHLKGKFAAYVLSYIYLGIYWNNHHHLMHAVDRVDGAIMWANLHLLFWLSVVPFTTAWMGESHGEADPAVLYGFSLVMAALAYTILVRTIIAEQLRHSHGKHSKLRDLIGADKKGWISLAIYVVGCMLAYVNVAIAYTLFAIVAMIWLVPDRRISTKISD